MKGKRETGFSLVELMIVVSIIAFLSVIAIPGFFKFLAKAKRAEAYMNLGSIYTSQKAYWAEHGKYSSDLSGSGGIGWKPEGYSAGGKNENFYYTYGFGSGAEGRNYFTGKLETPHMHLSMTNAGEKGFVVGAAGDIDGDGEPEVLSIDQFSNIKIIKDDLQ